MSIIKRVKNIEEAITLTMEGKRSGQWDLFRGQISAKWSVTSSIERLSKVEQKTEIRQLKLFLHWAITTKGMERFIYNKDALFAIAQHYGLKTNFIDFSEDPRIAAFFACDVKNNIEKHKESAIICLNKSDFICFWEKLRHIYANKKQNFVVPEIIRIDVENLWRLQKQKGIFLWNPINNIERYYNFDRIVFPFYVTHHILPKKEEVYPVNQSELEKMLTHFFMNKKKIEGNKVIRRLLRPDHVYTITEDTKNYEICSWWPAGISVSEDWRNNDDWNVKKIEQLDAMLPGFSLNVDCKITLKQLSEAILHLFTSKAIEINRDKLFEVSIIQGGYLTGKRGLVIACVRRLWNGMRTLPYSGPEIRTALENLIELSNYHGHDLFHAFGPDGACVDMCARHDGRGAYSRGTIRVSTLVGACNPAFMDAAQRYLSVDDESLGCLSLQLAGRPWERFTFNGLRKLMVEQLIPTQIAGQVNGDGDDGLHTVIFFSPTEFNVFGLS
ncbi:MAG: FRG domain-containing protein [Lentisphaeria bacterium]